MEIKTVLDLKDLDSLNQSVFIPARKTGILGFATLAVQPPYEQHKMQLRQLYVQQQSNENLGLQTDKEKEVQSYLENLQSICYLNGVKIDNILIRTLAPGMGKTASLSPSKKQSVSLIDGDALEVLKQTTISHYTITTCLGQKRYISFLLCYEPIYVGLIPQTHLQQAMNEFVLLPFAYVIVQDSPAFDFSKQILKGVFETSILPYYQMLCIIDQSSMKQQSYIQPLKVDLLLCYMFKIINRPLDDINVKILSDLRDNGTPIVYEECIQIYDFLVSDDIKIQKPLSINSEFLYKSNLSLKNLLSRVSLQNIVQLMNCLLLQKKLIIISRDTNINAYLIESLLELLEPLNSTIFLNITNLKQEMIDYIDSPVPYVIGIQESVWNKIFMRKWSEVSDDTVCFVIDTALLTTKVDLPNSPEPMTSILLQTLQDILYKHNGLNDKDLKIYFKQAFFNYILLIINDYRPFKVNFKEMENEKIDQFGSFKESSIIGLRQIFKFDSYLESQQIENYDFYSIFTETQLFNDFIERALRTNVDRSLSYFIASLDVLKHSQNFQELLNFQQQVINALLIEASSKTITYSFQDIIESYERALAQFDKSVYVKSLPLHNSNDNGIFYFNPANINVNIIYEIQKQSCIRNLIKRPTASRKIKPSKKSDHNLNKQCSFATKQNESRNQSSSIKENQQLISHAYFQKGPQKVSTPKGLPSEIKSIGNFLSEDDSKSTNSKDLKGSQEESKSETSSIKSFFRFTFEKIQSKLKSNKNEALPLSQSGTPQKQLQLMFDPSKFKVISLSGISNQVKEIKRSPDRQNLPNQAQYKTNQQQQNKSIFSTAFGPKTGISYGRPKCYSETASSQIKGSIQQQIPSNVHYTVDPNGLDARPCAISISNKSFHDSPNSSSYINDQSFALTQKGRNETSQSVVKTDTAMFRTSSTRETPMNQMKLLNVNTNQKNQNQQQLAYSILNSGIMIVRDKNRNTKRLVQKININLDPEDSHHKRQAQRLLQSSMHTNQPQISQSLSNSSLPNTTNTNSSSQKTINPSRSGGLGGIQNGNKTQLTASGLDSPTELSQNLVQKSSEKKIKNQSFKQNSYAGSKPASSGRQKAISQNQPYSQYDQSLKKVHITGPIIQPQQNFKQYQTKPKATLKIKRDSDIPKSSLANNLNTNMNIGSLVAIKKNFSDKNTPMFSRQDKHNTNSATSSLNQQPLEFSQVNSSHQQSNSKKNILSNQKQSEIISIDDNIDGFQARIRSISYQMNQPEFQSHLKYKMKKDKSLKNLSNSNSNHNIQSPSLQKEPLLKAKALKQTHNTVSKIGTGVSGDQHISVQKSQIQSFNEYSTYEIQQNQTVQYEPMIDTELSSDTPKMKFDGPTQNFDQSSSSNPHNTKTMGQLYASGRREQHMSSEDLQSQFGVITHKYSQGQLEKINQ
ncbi:UNKNOWN [Stylonychia lemnae]|uniref:UDENN domain-containing protein n=1 Tax=Stylonychia lemnae TaxID=5949 RepID=A0A078A1Q9_STYLE|nr:UNKNOWN [Stylonychia lemnae]|eukprot:CDW76045.1 UNKNOWN [Stylonychia lemnae]